MKKSGLPQGWNSCDVASSLPIRISTRLTFLHKFVLPPLGIGFFLFVMVSSFAGVLPGQIGNPGLLPWIALLGAILGTLLAYWLPFRFKEVWLERDRLVISNFLATEMIPFANVAEIRCWTFLSPNLVNLRLSHDSPFGKSIYFVAPWRPDVWIFHEHPLVRQLRDEVSKSQCSAKPGNN